MRLDCHDYIGEVCETNSKINVEITGYLIVEITKIFKQSIVYSVNKFQYSVGHVLYRAWSL